MIYEPSAAVTAKIERYVHVFMGDGEVRIVGNHVQMFVNWFGTPRYIEDLGEFDNPRIAHDAVLSSDAWRNRSTYSAKAGIMSNYGKLIRERPY